MHTCKSDEGERQARPFRELVARFLCDVSSLLAACMHTVCDTAMIRRRLLKAHVVLTTLPERRLALNLTVMFNGCDCTNWCRLTKAGKT